jgi:hypothetical protein
MARRYWLAAGGVGFLLFLGVLSGQEPISQPARPIKKNLKPSELAEILAEPVAVAGFQEEMSIEEFLARLTIYYRESKGKEVLFRIYEGAFKEENPAEPPANEATVKIPPVPSMRTGAQLLRAALARIPTNNATYQLRPGHIEITTYQMSRAWAMLSEPVMPRFKNRPLHLALEELFELTGVPVVLDGRVGNLARAEVNLHIGKEMPLGTVLFLMSETANLKVIVVDEITIVTTPALAQQMLLEQWLRTYGSPAWVEQMNRDRWRVFGGAV